MDSLTNKLPQQRQSYAEKMKNKQEWGKNCVNAVCFNSDYTYHNLNMNKTQKNGFVSDYDRMLSNYRLYNNQINQDDFQRECDPFNVNSENFKDIIHPYNKTYNKINVLVGEEWKRPFGYMAVLVNSEATNQYTRQKDQLVEQYVGASLQAEIEKIKLEKMKQNPAPENQGNPEEYQQQMQQYEQQIQAEVDKVLNPEQIEKYMSTKWRPAAEIAADKILNILIRKQSIKKIKNDGFKHANISGGEFIWVGVINGEPKIELLNPLKVFYHKSSEIEYIQDSMYAGYRTKMTIADILDRFADDLTEKDKQKLEDMYNSADSGIRGDLIGKTFETHGLNTSFEWRHMNHATMQEGSYGFSNIFDIDVAHVEWRSQRKVGFLTFPNQDGIDSMKMVDELFELPENAKKVSFKDKNNNKKIKYQFTIDGEFCELEWRWIPEVWEGTKIAGDIYVNIRPKSCQFRSSENPFKVKLGYHGITFNSMNAPSISTMDRMRPFQFLYFVVMHKLKELIAADAAPLVNIDMSMIPKKLTNEQYMQYMKLGVNFYDPNQNNEGSSKQLSGQKVTYNTERSTTQHIINYINILNSLDEQIGDVAGVSKPREGQTNAAESATGTQTSIMQSSNVTELLFTAHNLLWEQVLTSLVEVAEQTWGKDKKSIPYMLDDMTRGFLELTPETFQNCEFGVFITDSAKDNDILQQLRNLTQPMLQNNYKMSDIITILQSTSMEALKREMKSLEDVRDQMAQQQEQAQQQHEKDMQAAEIANREDTQEFEFELQDRKYDHEKEIAAMEVYKFQKELDANQDGEPDFLAAQMKEREILTKSNLEIAKLNANQVNDDKRMLHEKEMKNKDVQMKKEDNDTKIKVAKLKPKPKPAAK